jgi:hypothetical protein
MNASKSKSVKVAKSTVGGPAKGSKSSQVEALAKFGEFKGNKLVVFGASGDDFGFSFGKGKAAKMLAAIDLHGAEYVVNMLRELVEEAPKEARKRA